MTTTIATRTCGTGARVRWASTTLMRPCSTKNCLVHEEPPSEPELKKTKVDQAMVPTFMGDTGFDAAHLDDWRRAEKKLGIINAAAKQTKNSKAAPTPPPPPLT